MSFLRLQKGLLSPFEALVLTSIQDIGPGATFPQIFDKANELGPWNGRIRFVDLHMTLFRLDSCGCVYSWPDEAERDRRWRDTRHFRVQLRGERLLEAAKQRRKDSEQPDGSLYPPNMMAIIWNWLSGRPRH